MKNIIIICGLNCGYCKKAKMLIKHALEKDERFLAIDIRYVQENDDEGRLYKHSLLPAFYAGNKLFYEGNPSSDIINALLERCYSNR